MKNKFKSLILFLVVATILGIAASNIIRIRDIQGDKAGDPTLKQRLGALADSTYLSGIKSNIQNQTDSIKLVLPNKVDKLTDGFLLTDTFPTRSEVELGYTHNLISDYTQHQLVNDNVETVVFTDTIPANTFSAGRILQFKALFSFTNSTNNKYFRVKINGTAVGYWNTATTGQVAFQGTWHLWCRGSNVQIGMGPTSSSSNRYDGSTAALSTYAFDYTQQWIVTVTIQMQVNTETAALEAFKAIYNP